ncbi:uncharacterized protein LTR77_000623 [Saxophila tyrrhenica]|uniref:Putative ER transporter 6TM N-terminal domain-containing protein n=1 Tax=Saxophila tyrrhenica TaxID=1690608 RepID=A0AAV9PNI6_9PEZI|nr:hypothetical protein LTR77_000623 [Saxophila tyrrhenica]
MAGNGWARSCWEKSGLSLQVLLILFKSALAPTVALCLLLNDRVAAYYGPVGYITAILSINPVLPQAQFLELMTQQSFGICLATAATLLQLFCVIKARENTSPPLPPPPPNLPPTAALPPVPYNSSAAVVSAVWLVFLVFLVCYVRSARPQLTLACINTVIVVVVTSSIGPTLPNMRAALTFAKQLLVINLTGLALSVAVNLLIWPTTNRGAFKQDLRMWQLCIERCLAARAAVMDELWMQLRAVKETEKEAATTTVPTEGVVDTASPTQELLAVVDRMQTDLLYAKRELSIKKLTANDLSAIRALLYEVLQPVIGLMSGADRVKRLIANVDIQAHSELLLAEHAKATEAQGTLIDILQHSLQILGIAQGSRLDEEATMGGLQSLENRVQILREMRRERIEAWQHEYGSHTDKGSMESEQSLLFVVLDVGFVATYFSPDFD